MSSESARDIIGRADRARADADAAEMARVKIRLYERPVMRRGLLGFRKREEWLAEVEFTAAETLAIYRALGVLAGQHAAEARELESRVSAAGPSTEETP